MGRRDEQPAVEFPEGDVATEKEKLKAPERNELDVRRFVKRLRLTPILIGCACGDIPMIAGAVASFRFGQGIC